MKVERTTAPAATVSFPGQGHVASQVDLNLPARPLRKGKPEEIGFELVPSSARRTVIRGRKVQSSSTAGSVSRRSQAGSSERCRPRDILHPMTPDPPPKCAH